MKKTMTLAVLALFLAACAAPQTTKAPPSAAKRPAAVSDEADRSATESPAVGGGPLWTPPPAPPAPSAPGREAPSLRQIGASGSPAPARTSGEEKYVSLNFDNADIVIVIQTIAELIDLNYIIGSGVSGRATIQSTSKIPVSSLFTVLEELLEVNGLTAVKANRVKSPGLAKFI